eukprot:scaffold9772_cov128-Isochrysis_galbana.AAC.9
MKALIYIWASINAATRARHSMYGWPAIQDRPPNIYARIRTTLIAVKANSAGHQPLFVKWIRGT